MATHWSESAAAPRVSVKAIATAHIVANWESQDEPEHLRTIRDRFYAHPERTNRLLGLYQQILKKEGIRSDDSLEQRELRLTGAIVKRDYQLQVFNPIHACGVVADGVSQSLANIRPFALSFNRWITADKTESVSLLTGIELEAAKAWASGKSLSDQDYAYLAASQEAAQDRVEAALAVEAQAKAILAEANRKANRRIKQGVGVLGLAAALLAGSLLFSAQTVQSARVEAANAKESAQQSRAAARESQSIAEKERENARQARQAVSTANRETKAANETAQLAKAEAQQALEDTQAALEEAVAAEEIAQQAQRAAAVAKQDTQRARAETAEATAQRQQAEREVRQAQVDLAQANQAIEVAQTERNELSTGTRLERSALALVRQSTNLSLDDLVEAVD